MESLSSLISLVPAPPGAAIARASEERRAERVSRSGGPARATNAASLGERPTAERIELRDARALFESGDVLVAHAAFVAGRLGSRSTTMLFDVLELFAFVRPGLPFVPSALGLARALVHLYPDVA